MKKKQKCFPFYTMGGYYRWEDVFYYQKWRIQRNYKSKQYRLLDNWDIRREEGSFDDCYKKFLKIIDVYQLSRQHGHMIVMIPGIAQSKNIFKPLWREVMQYNYMAAAVNYPSTYKKIDAHVRQLDFFLNHMEDVEEISFVTNGSGALVLRKLLYFDTEWKSKMKIRKVIEINPPSVGSQFWKRMGKFKWAQKLFGPMISDITPSGVQKIPEYNKNYKVGIIRCESLPMQILSYLPEILRKYLPFYEDYMHGNIRDVIKLKSNSMSVMCSPEVASKCLKFLKNGEF